MNILKMTKNVYIKSAFLGLVGILVCYAAHVNESEVSRAGRVNFPGITFVHLNKTMKNLNLEKSNAPHPDLISVLNSRHLKVLSSVYNDKNSTIKVVITQSSIDGNFIFAVLKNNELTQLQKINEITENQISLQYGKIVLNSNPLTAVAETADTL